MRVLITTQGSAGHLGPLVPFAEAIRGRGDEVLFASRESTAGSVRRAGYDVWAFPDASGDDRDAAFRGVPGMSTDEANVHVVSEIFGRLDARAAVPAVLEACERWSPDVILHETCEFAGGLAAERLGIPGVRVGITLGSTEAVVIPAVSAALRDLRRYLGLRDDAAGERITGAPYFTLTPAAMEDAASPGVRGAQRFRENGGTAPRPLPDWWAGDHRPLLYVTFGTVVPQFAMFPNLYRAAIDAVAGLPARVLVTIGRDSDPAALGPLPGNVHVERWVAQADVMPEAAAMVCHGGFGTVRAGLAAGVPMVVLPLFADQPYNARRVAELGAGIAVPGGPPAVGRIGEAVRTLLGDATYAERAGVVAAETRALPPVDTAAEILRELAAR
jgi:UDP:flavonoid glycosyltransferase YjiC (YdhE family)